MIDFRNSEQNALFANAYSGSSNYRHLISSICMGGKSEELIVFFTSNDIWELTFNDFYRSVIVNDRYEFQKTATSKHSPLQSNMLFLRDINKSWYYYGINRDIDSREKLCSFIQQYCQGKKIVTVGSSAGGYAAIYFGTRLKAERIVVFDPQIDIQKWLLNYSGDPKYNYLEKEVRENTVSLDDMIASYHGELIWFYSSKSKIDIEQIDCIKSESTFLFPIVSSDHGLTILGENMMDVIDMNSKRLKELSTWTIQNNVGSIRFLFKSCHFRRALGIAYRKFLRIIKKYFHT